MLKGFREFILRGNVVELAVAVVIGAAFTGIVNAIVSGVLNPVIALIFDAKDLAAAGWSIRAESAPGAGDGITISYGLVLSAVIQFLLVAIVIYFGVITPMNYLKKIQFSKRNQEPVEETPAPPSELELLGQIRDLLAADQAAHHGKHTDASAETAPDGATPATPSSAD